MINFVNEVFFFTNIFPLFNSNYNKLSYKHELYMI